MIDAGNERIMIGRIQRVEWRRGHPGCGDELERLMQGVRDIGSRETYRSFYGLFRIGFWDRAGHEQGEHQVTGRVV